MRIDMQKVFIMFILIFLFFQISAQPPKYEMRGVWIATVENIDWPTTRNLSAEAQKAELIQLLNLVKSWNLNTVVLQIRPCADAFYPSTLEPWSVYLTGEQGKPPEPFYDPLEAAIKECRKRGLAIHVWLNPYRAIRDTSHITAASHITRRHPEWFVTYGSTVYFNPALQETRDHTARVVADIVKRYDIDAIHMDDYFYPYRIAGVPFPDDSSFMRNNRGYSPKKKEDWRRDNVNLIIKQLHDTIKHIKPYVQFGISPFGVWRNADKDSSGSATRAGQTNYDDLYADILKWQKEGWIDYVTPQLYWQIGMKVADYAVLADWWNRNTFGCPLYIGQAFYRIDRKSSVKAWRKPDEIIRQIELNRSLQNIEGSIFFSAKYLRTNPLRLKQKLIKKVYPFPALFPPNDRIEPVLPEKPAEVFVVERNDSLHFQWSGTGENIAYAIYRLKNRDNAVITAPENLVTVTGENSLVLSKRGQRKYHYYLTAISRTGVESDPVTFIKQLNMLCNPYNKILSFDKKN